MQGNKFVGLNKTSIGVPDLYQRNSTSGYNTLNGVYLAKVVDIVDEDYQGQMTVELIGHQTIGSKETQSDRRRYHKIRPTSRFGGTIQLQNATQTYGENYPPPAPGTEVLVAFTGREQEGYLLGVLGDANRNAMIPGLPASRLDDEPDVIGAALDTRVNQQQDGNKRIRHPQANAVAEQGIGLDPVRGLGSSGGRRESPSRVSGQLTPEGHSFVMDDGTSAYQEGVNQTPDKSREAGQNKLIRLRSAGGAQMLFNDTAGIVYIINQSGSSWIQMDESGNVDVYAQGSVSYHAEEDLNFYAGGDFNVDADSINIKARGSDGVKAEATTGRIELYANRDMRLTTDLNMHLLADGFSRQTAKLIDFNGPVAQPATKPTTNSIPVNMTVKESINGRVPEHEPWGGHLENINSVAAQAPSRIDNSTKDYDVSDMISGTGRAGPQ